LLEETLLNLIIGKISDQLLPQLSFNIAKFCF